MASGPLLSESLARFLLNRSSNNTDVDPMYAPQSIREENPLKKIAKESLEKPGMYLIALRTHLGRGKTMLGDVLDTVAEALPTQNKIGEPDEA